MSRATLNLTADLYHYLQAVSLREPEVLRELRIETAQLPDCFMQIAPEQGQFMMLLIELLGARRTLDIGVYTGYSSLAVALALPADGEVIACDVNENITNIAKKYWQKAGMYHKIKLHLAPAGETLDKLLAEGQQGSFDFVFIDADKDGYPSYYEKSLQLLRPGGLILIDNMLWSGAVVDPTDNSHATNVIRALNKRLHEDERVTVSLLPLGDGLSVVRKR